MKCITREIKVYGYTFANIDFAKGEAVSCLHEVERAEPMSKREIRDFSKNHDGAILLMETERAEKFSLPIDRFVEACKAYSETLNSAGEDKINEQKEG